MIYSKHDSTILNRNYKRCHPLLVYLAISVLIQMQEHDKQHDKQQSFVFSGIDTKISYGSLRDTSYVFCQYFQQFFIWVQKSVG